MRPDLPRHTLTIPQRGVRIIPPPNIAAKLETIHTMRAQGEKGKVTWTDTERTHIHMLVKHDGMLTKRYPTPEVGKAFMQHVDYDRREYLYGLSQQLTTSIVSEWNQIAPGKDIAVILFGSVARGHVRHKEHPDPSNIDLAVIGDISDQERTQLFEAIRPHRLATQAQILQSCGLIQSEEANPGNAGVLIQHTSKLTNGGYNWAQQYISSSAVALHDPAGLWQKIEREAMDAYSDRQRRKKRR